MKEIQILNNGDALYDIRRKINENFELVQQEVEDMVVDPITKFGVNEGNETNGVADLMDITDGTLSFKVGGEYPNLVMTSGDGVTTKIENVNPLYLQNLADGEYTVVVDGSNSNITDAEFYSQLLEPENVNEGDVWFNGENALKLENGTINVELMPNTNFTPSFFVSQGDIYVAGGHGYRVLRSVDGGKNWLLVTYDTEADNSTLIGGAYVNGAFYLVGTNKRVYKTETTGGWIFEELPSVNGTPTKFIKVRNNFFVIITTEGAVLRSTDMVTWTINSGWSGKDIADIVYFNNTYYFFTTTGQVYTSTDFSNLEPTETTISAPSRAFVYKNLILIGNQTGGITVYDPVNGSTELIQLQNPGKVNHFHLRQDGGLLVLGGYNICSVTYNLKDFSQIYETGGNLICGDDNFIMGTSGILLKTTSSSVWTSYPYIPVGEVIISGGEVTYFTTYPYNTNGLFEATSSTFGLLRTAAEPDELNCHCQEAVLTPANLYNLNNYRTMNTSYEVDQKVGCPYHHNLQLNCIQAGTTSNEGLNTKGLLEPGTTIEDGTVIWEVQELGTASGGIKDKITNCLLEVPQRIKLELNNGVLTLKAGSVVTVPNGFEEDGTTKRFDEVTIENDVQFTYADGQQYVAYVYNKNDVWVGGVNSITTSFSGEVDSGIEWRLWYNTKQNIINRYNSAGITENKCSFPVCIYNSSSTQITAIIQTFNGFGYIGSTVWVDKGVKGLIPNGRNEDGSLRNTEITTQNISTKSVDSGNGTFRIALVEGGGIFLPAETTFIDGVREFDIEENYFKQGSEILKWCEIGSISANVTSPYNITSFNSKLPFRAVDAQSVDGAWVSKQLHLSSTKTDGTEKIDLSTYLPNDGCDYMVLFETYMNHHGSSMVYKSLQTDLMSQPMAVNHASTYSYYSSNNIWLPVGQSRYIERIHNGAPDYTSTLTAHGYRRMGA